MSKLLFKISDDYKCVYFTLSHDKKDIIGVQNHQDKTLSACSDMYSMPNFDFHF